MTRQIKKNQEKNSSDKKKALENLGTKNECRDFERLMNQYLHQCVIDSYDAQKTP